MLYSVQRRRLLAASCWSHDCSTLRSHTRKDRINARKLLHRPLGPRILCGRRRLRLGCRRTLILIGKSSRKGERRTARCVLMGTRDPSSQSDVHVPWGGGQKRAADRTRVSAKAVCERGTGTSQEVSAFDPSRTEPSFDLTGEAVITYRKARSA